MYRNVGIKPSFHNSEDAITPTINPQSIAPGWCGCDLVCGLARSVSGAVQVVSGLVEGVAVSVEGVAGSVWCAVGLVTVCAVGESLEATVLCL